MNSYVMFGRYPVETITKINAARTDEAVKIIKNCGGEVKDMCVLLGGNYDLMFSCEFSNNEDAMKASVNMSRKLGLQFCTCPSVGLQQFDKICAA